MRRPPFSLEQLILAVAFVIAAYAVQACLAQQVSADETKAAVSPGPTLKSSEPKGTDDSDLMIGRGDLLDITMFGTDFHQEARVSSSGDISLPLIGSVRVGGLTPETSKKLIHDKFVQGHFYKDPQISILVKEYSSGGVHILGEVQKPGFYPLTNIRTLPQAISVAGGFTPKAGKVVTITNPDRPQRTLTLTLSQEPQQTAQELMSGDTIDVSKAGIVYVVGEVHLPSGIVMEHGDLTVLQAIAMAQGTNTTASLAHAKLIRRTVDGPQEIPLSLKKILAAKAPDIKLEPDDIVFVPSSLSRNAGKRGLETALQLATGILIWGRY